MMEREIKVSGYIHLEWFDPRVTWLGMREFASISSIDMDSNTIWLPRITIRDGEIQDLNTFAEEAKPVKVYMDGRVMMTRLVIITATCDLGLNVNDYPFDKHKCPLSQGKNFNFKMIFYS